MPNLSMAFMIIDVLRLIIPIQAAFKHSCYKLMVTLLTSDLCLIPFGE